MRKKLILSLCLSAVLAVGIGAGSVTAFAEEKEPESIEIVETAEETDEDISEDVPEEVKEFETEELSDGTLKLIKYNGTDTAVVIPKTIDGKTVSAIGAYAINSDGIVSVKLLKSVTSIDNYAIGYTEPESDEQSPAAMTGLKILCYDKTAAKTYADANGFEAVLHQHTYKITSQTKATCTTAGKTVYKCSDPECADSYTTTAAKLGHSYTIKLATTKPTLTAKGYTTYKCSRCSATTKKDYVAALKDISKAKVTNVKDGYVYTGSAIKPNPVLTYGSTKLKKGTDYTVTYSANTNAGTAKITIKGKGAYAGTKTVTFKVKQRSIKKATVTGLKELKKYTGGQRKQSLTLTYNGKKLKNGTDYTISYKNNINIGTAQVIIKGKGNFGNTLTLKYKIVRTGWFKYNGNYYYYSGKGVKYKSGVYKIGDYYYCFADSGVMQTGWQNIGSSYYLFDRLSGKRQENTTVDGIKLGKDGKAAVTSWAQSKIDTMMRAHSIMLAQTKPTDTMEQKRLKCFNWVLSFPYHRYRLLSPIYRQQGWEMTFANDIFINHQGCCVAEASATAFLFREIGYTDVAVCHDTSHSWTTIGKYLYDPVFAEAKSFSKNYNILPYDYRVNPVDRRVIG